MWGVGSETAGDRIPFRRSLFLAVGRRGTGGLLLLVGGLPGREGGGVSGGRCDGWGKLGEKGRGGGVGIRLEVLVAFGEMFQLLLVGFCSRCCERETRLDLVLASIFLKAKISTPRSRIRPHHEGCLDNALLCPSLRGQRPYRIPYPGAIFRK